MSLASCRLLFLCLCWLLGTSVLRKPLIFRTDVPSSQHNSQEHLKRNSAACFEAKGLSGGAFLSLSYPQLVTANTHETTAETGGQRPDQTAKGYDSAESRPARQRREQSRNAQPDR